MEIEHVSESPEIAAPREIPPLPGIRTNLSPAEVWIPLIRWSREHHLGPVSQIATVPNRVFSLTTENHVLSVQIHGLLAKFDGINFHLGFEPQLIDDQPFVHALDLKKNIEPLLQNLVLPAKTNRIVVIDPGHGGVNAGTKSLTDGSDEKEFTLDLAVRLKPLLEKNDWQVFLTRTNDTDISLSNRVTFADAHNADLFISLHFNAVASNLEQAGLETLCLTPVGMHSTFTRGYDDDPALVFPNNKFDTENLQYAMLLHRALLKGCGFNDRGVRRARFLGVLRRQNRPAVLIEAGFLSNTNESRRIADSEFRQKLAETIAGALE